MNLMPVDPRKIVARNVTKSDKVGLSNHLINSFVFEDYKTTGDVYVDFFDVSGLFSSLTDDTQDSFFTYMVRKMNHNSLSVRDAVIGYVDRASMLNGEIDGTPKAHTKVKEYHTCVRLDICIEYLIAMKLHDELAHGYPKHLESLFRRIYTSHIYPTKWYSHIETVFTNTLTKLLEVMVFEHFNRDPEYKGTTTESRYINSSFTGLCLEVMTHGKQLYGKR